MKAQPASGVYALLADGATVEIRPAAASDFDAVWQMHRAMSADSIYLRFFSMSLAGARQAARRICREPAADHAALLAWLAGVACLITLWTLYGAPAQDNYSGSDPGQALLDQHFQRQSGDSLTLAIRSSAPVTSPAVRARVAAALAPLARAPHVTSVGSPYRVPGQVSRDGHIAFATIPMSMNGR